ncbi:DUF4262 domain-containing protein [Hymenobacter edaphi]|nr:DUF4262 domain-containing protein [Hymenobacter edaphi]
MDTEHEEHNRAAEQRIIADIEQYGCHLGLIRGDDYLPAFAYTIGLYRTYQHPEIICLGLPESVLFAVLAKAHELVKEGRRLAPGQRYDDFLEGYDVQFLPVDQAYYPSHLGYAGWYYGSSWEFPVLQLVWPDKQHRFPWEPEANPNWKFKQPLLDRNADFRFLEERDLGVYTTTEALQGQPIRYVYHNADGDWQFHSEDSPNIEHAAVVALEVLVQRDSSLNDLHQLPLGWMAWRETANDEWSWEADEVAEEETEE